MATEAGGRFRISSGKFRGTLLWLDGLSSACLETHLKLGLGGTRLNKGMGERRGEKGHEKTGKQGIKQRSKSKKRTRNIWLETESIMTVNEFDPRSVNCANMPN